MGQLEVVDLSDEELEALRLKNVEGLDQVVAAEKMGTSQSTFQRILSSAHKKVSFALVNGNAIKIHEVERLSRKLECRKCNYAWNVPFDKRGRVINKECPKCQSREV